MKKVTAFILLMCLMSLCLLPASASETAEPTEARVKLSALSEEECRAYLASQGVVIPDNLSTVSTVWIVAHYEEDPDSFISMTISYTPYAELLEQIRAVVKAYYGLGAGESALYAPDSSNSLQYTLQYSTLYSWNTSMTNYKCYAYALGRTTNTQPGDFSDGDYESDGSIYDLASLVKADLQGGLGYSCVKLQYTTPTSTSGWTNVIAARKDTTGDIIGFNDYHFAKLTSSGWLHKPGTSAVLKFNSAPTNTVAWTNEGYNGYSYYSGYITYDSNIAYLLYKGSHGDTNYTSTGNNYHSGARHYYEYQYICKDCGAVIETEWVSVSCSGPPCPVFL